MMEGGGGRGGAAPPIPSDRSATLRNATERMGAGAAGLGLDLNLDPRSHSRTAEKNRQKVTTKKVSSAFVVTLRVVVNFRKENRHIWKVTFILLNTERVVHFFSPNI